jgi:hypothetical protein
MIKFIWLRLGSGAYFYECYEGKEENKELQVELIKPTILLHKLPDLQILCF